MESCAAIPAVVAQPLGSCPPSRRRARRAKAIRASAIRSGGTGRRCHQPRQEAGQAAPAGTHNLRKDLRTLITDKRYYPLYTPDLASQQAYSYQLAQIVLLALLRL